MVIAFLANSRSKSTCCMYMYSGCRQVTSLMMNCRTAIIRVIMLILVVILIFFMLTPFSALYNTRALFASRMPVLTSLLIDLARVKKTEIHLFFTIFSLVMLQFIIDVFFADSKILRDMRRVSVVDFHVKGFRGSKTKWKKASLILA